MRQRDNKTTSICGLWAVSFEHVGEVTEMVIVFV